ncbi:MAG TPA: caspase family protein [Thermoanaerobaculia bacterium]|nr:caspase family protein [Thermoanaerobaculia bacterium]
MLGDQASARIYRDRAIFNGVSKVECQTAAGSTEQFAALPSHVRQKFALVVGIGRFQDASIPRLQYAAKDAKDVAAVLADPRYGNFDPANITLLTDEKATRAAILNAMQQIFLQAREEDLVVTYVSSHGSPAEKERGLGGIGYIVTYDANVKNLWVDGLEYKDFAKKTMMIKARRKVTFLDTCFSGEASKRGEKALSIEGVGVDHGTAKMFLSGEGTFVITSSGANERSWESDRIQNSYFTYYLIDALKRAKEPPTIKEVFEYLSARVPAAVAREKQALQHPQMQPSDGPGDVRIGVAPRDSSTQ